MELETTPLSGLFLAHRHLHVDDRGTFTRLFGEQDLISAGRPLTPRQVNLSVTRRVQTIRGFHLQRSPYAEAKLVTCVAGAIFDVAVDLRPNSATFLRSFGTELRPDIPVSMLLPEGFAHAFLTLEPDCQVAYVASEQHHPEYEDGFRFDDPLVAVAWPLEPRHWSDRDGAWPALEPRLDTFEGTSGS